MTFGEKLQYLRKTKNISQEQLAGQLTVSRQAVSKWELDAASPDTDNIIQLSRLFGVTTDWLLIGEDDVPTVSAPPPQSEADPRPNTMLTRAAQIVLIFGGIALVTLLFIFGLSLLVAGSW